jgi:hypothetical protein
MYDETHPPDESDAHMFSLFTSYKLMKDLFAEHRFEANYLEFLREFGSDLVPVIEQKYLHATKTSLSEE